MDDNNINFQKLNNILSHFENVLFKMLNLINSSPNSIKY